MQSATIGIFTENETDEKHIYYLKNAENVLQRNLCLQSRMKLSFGSHVEKPKKGLLHLQR